MKRLVRHQADPRLEQQFNTAITRRDFGVAEALGFELLTRHPGHQRVRKRLAGILFRRGRIDEAHDLIAAGIGPRLASAIASGVLQLLTDLGVARGASKSWRYVTRGMSAVCAIEYPDTAVDGLRFITKVVDPRSPSTAREVAFYTRLTRSSSVLRSLAPRLIDYRRVPGSPLSMLTLEMLDGRRPSVLDVVHVFEAWLALARASDDLVRAGIKLTRSRWRDELRRVTLGRYRDTVLYTEIFCWIHTRRASLDLFGTILRRLHKRRAPERALVAARRLERYWFDLEVHARIVPRRDYSLIHGDFHEANLIVDSATNSCRVIDWESASWGPPGLDMSGFAAGLHSFEFEHLERHVLQPLIGGARLPRDRQAASLLLAMLLVRWLGQRSIERLDATFERTVEPALAWILHQRVP
jgi:hypothetical protein